MNWLTCTYCRIKVYLREHWQGAEGAAVRKAVDAAARETLRPGEEYVAGEKAAQVGSVVGRFVIGRAEKDLSEVEANRAQAVYDLAAKSEKEVETELKRRTLEAAERKANAEAFKAEAEALECHMRLLKDAGLQDTPVYKTFVEGLAQRHLHIDTRDPTHYKVVKLKAAAELPEPKEAE